MSTEDGARASIATRVADARARAGLTRAQLEAALRDRGLPHASVMTIRRNESGARAPTAEELIALAEVTGCSATWLLTGEPEDTAADRPPVMTAARGSRSTKTESAWRRVLAHLEAELARQSDRPGGPDLSEVIGRVDERLGRLTDSGEIDGATAERWHGARAALALLSRRPPGGPAVGP